MNCGHDPLTVVFFTSLLVLFTAGMVFASGFMVGRTYGAAVGPEEAQPQHDEVQKS